MISLLKKKTNLIGAVLGGKDTTLTTQTLHYRDIEDYWRLVESLLVTIIRRDSYLYKIH